MSDGPIPRWARVADALAGTALAIAALTVITGGLDRTEVYGIRVSVNRPERAFLLACAILIFRHLREPRHPRLAHIWREFGGLSDSDERRLFGQWSRHTVPEFLLASVGFAVLVSAVTWPQVRDLYSVPDLGDPLFSVWRLAWIAHQIRASPSELFNGNIFHPESLTLTYSDSILFPAAVGAPFLWAGVHVLPVYTFVFLGAWVFSGVSTYYLVRALTGRRDAAAVAGIVFAIYPYRFEHYPHLEQQMTMWAPLVLLLLHRTLAAARLRDGVGTGIAFALQMYSCMYVALFLAAFMVPVGATLWLARGRPTRPLRGLAAGALLAAVLIAPLAIKYLENKPMFGERLVEEIEYYSAVPADYLEPHQRSLLYGAWHEGGQPERQLFPGVVCVLLASVGFWPRWSAARLAYVVAGAFAFDASLGMHGISYPILHDYIGAYRGLRVPARFSILFGLTLAVGAGYGVARILERRVQWQRPLAALFIVLAIVDAWPRLELTPVWRTPPAIYTAIPPEPSAILAEFPMTRSEGRELLGFRYMYFSTFHWHRLLDGNSGFFPPSWFELQEKTETFPNEAAIAYLKSRGVQYIAIHGGFYEDAELFADIQELLAQRPDVERLSAARFNGGMSELYRLR